MAATFTITGRIGGIRHYETSAQIDVATDRRTKRDEKWETVTDWNRITLFGSRAKYAEQHLAKGDLIEARGRMGRGSYEKDGETIYTVDCVVEDIERLMRAEANRDTI